MSKQPYSLEGPTHRIFHTHRCFKWATLNIGGQFLGFFMVILSLLLMSTISWSAQDCDSLKSDVEKAICLNSDVSHLDQELNEVYASLRKSLPAKQKAKLQSEQKTWLNERNECMNKTYSYATCMSKKYKDRIADLKLQLPSSINQSTKKTFTESKETMLFQNSDYTLSKVRLQAKSVSDKGKSCTQQEEVLRIKSVSKKEPPSFAKLREKEMLKDPLNECEKFREDHDLEIVSSLTFRMVADPVFEIKSTYSRIAVTNQKDSQTYYYDLKTGETVDLSNYLRPGYEKDLSKETYVDLDSENEGTGKVSELYAKDSRCTEKPKFVVASPGMVEAELCPTPPFRGPVVKIKNWKKYFIENEVSNSLVGRSH